MDDLRLALRGLWRTKGFSVAAVLTLAIGLGGATVMFALVQGVLLRPLAVRDQDRIIVAWKEMRGAALSHDPFGDREIDFVRDASRLIEMAAGVDAHGVGRGLFTEDGESDYAVMGLVAGPFFQVLGVEAVLGRALTAADDVEGAEPVVVINHGLWTRRYARSPSVIGRKITIAEQRFTIVGVMPRDLDYPVGIELWRPTHTVPTTGPFGDAARAEIDLLARLRPGVTIDQARSELAALLSRAEPTRTAAPPRDIVPIVHSLEDVIVGNVRASIAGLMVAVALVLVIACANVANLLLMRGEGKRAELAVREALGATRARMARQLLAESAVLTAIAAGVGFIVSWWGLRTLLSVVPEGLPRIESVRVDAAVMIFTLLIALVASCMAGLAPSLTLMRGTLLPLLTTGSRGSSGVASTYGRRVLVVAQVALAVVIVTGAGLLTRSVLRLQGLDIGFSSDRLLFAELSMPESASADRARHSAFLDRAISELQALPGVESATPVNVKPFAGVGWDVPRFTAEGQEPARAAANPALNLESIYPNYFATFSISMVRGRAFAEADREGTQLVAILSDNAAAAAWPGENPIGKRIRMGIHGPGSQEPWLTVVGVAATTRYRELTRPRPTLYLPAAQFHITAQRFVLRTTVSADRLASAIRDRIGAIDASVQVVRVAPFARMLDVPLARPRFNAFLLGIFGLTALLLSAIGLYAVVAASVRQRDREIAIRLALGATGATVRGLVLREAMWLSGAGSLIGLAGALAGTRLLRELIYEIDVLDPLALAGAVLLSIAGSLLASYLPMLRAARIDAMSVLRS